jgi:surface antigen
MDKTRLPISLFFSFSIICLAGALAYFSYAIVETIRFAPTLIEQLRQTTREIDPVLEEIDKVAGFIPPVIHEVSLVREQIPAVLAEAAEIRRQIPLILTEVEKVRQELPAVLAEVAKIRQEVPGVVAEVANVRAQIPVIIAESQAYRDLIPQVLTEVESTRNMIPPTLDRAEQLVADMRGTGKEASEGAVTGFFTGLIKAPFKIVGGVSESIFGNLKGLDKHDTALMAKAAEDVVNSGVVGSSKTWKNKNSSVSGKVTLLKEYKMDERLCRDIELVSFKRNRILDSQQHAVCLNKDGLWELLQ